VIAGAPVVLAALAVAFARPRGSTDKPADLVEAKA
jgi:hypothetical protein